MERATTGEQDPPEEKRASASNIPMLASEAQAPAGVVTPTDEAGIEGKT
ncbi:hypothetical protein NGA_0646600, partial [Nannochloropsis gaditana CCMP526]